MSSLVSRDLDKTNWPILIQMIRQKLDFKNNRSGEKMGNISAPEDTATDLRMAVLK